MEQQGQTDNRSGALLRYSDHFEAAYDTISQEFVTDIERALEMLAAGYQDSQVAHLSRTLTVEAYLDVLEELTPEELALAFSRAARESRFGFPNPAQLVAYSSRSDLGDPGAKEALAELRRVFAAQREFGVHITPKLGPVVRTHGEDGLVLLTPDRGADVFPEPLPAHTGEAVKLMGDGDYRLGLSRLALHSESFSEFLSGRDNREIETRWLNFWRESQRDHLSTRAFGSERL